MANENHPVSARRTGNAAGLYLTDEDVAAQLGVDARTVRAWRNLRGLPHLRITQKVVRYRQSDVDEWAASRRVAIRVAE
jgi:excisionase family DNA binding protein